MKLSLQKLFDTVEKRERSEFIMAEQYTAHGTWHVECACQDCENIYQYHQLKNWQKYLGYYLYTKWCMRGH